MTKNNNNISKSAVRVFTIYKKLLEKPCAKSDLLEYFSEDSLQIYLATLRKLGLKINVPKKNFQNYTLEQTHFCVIQLSQYDLKFLEDIKMLLAKNGNVNDLINFNRLIVELKKFTDNTSSQKLDFIAFKPPLSYQEHAKITALNEAILNSDSIVISYNSPLSAINYYKILPFELMLENEKIYLWGKDCLSNQIKYFRLERIKNIKSHGKNEEFQTTKFTYDYAICELSGKAALLVEENSKTKILKDEGNKIMVKFYFKNEFNFLQKTAMFGEECKILESKELKAKFGRNLSEVRKLYDTKI